jgi:alpha-amylase
MSNRNKVYFLMAIHFHQPIGNFNFVFDKVYRNSYQPFLHLVSEFPDIKLTLHFTGCLLEWLADNQPKFLDQIRRLVKSGQIEVMTGGFYEPILSVIPPNDALGQIAQLSDFVKRRFDYQPKGAWVAERVWEPNLPSLLNKAGVRYVILDDSHLKYAGLSADDMHGYYVTEDNGKAVAVFPSEEKLRYLVPFGQPQQIIDYLKSIASGCDGLAAVYGDDAEKFGEWPDTYEWVYEKRWLYNFFLTLRQNNSWIKTAHVSEYLEDNEPLGRVYMPTASYQEMGEWSLPADSGEKLDGLIREIKADKREEEFLPYLRGGFWRNFLVKYPEANQMHKKMLLVSKKIEGATAGKRLQEARQELYKGQCNCAYWHGVFGGLYLYHLRSAVFNHLIKAETIIDEILKGHKGWVDCQVGDFDCDGCDEAVLSDSSISVFLDSDEGGSITELDFKLKSVNVVNPLSRRKEAYHSKLPQRAGGGSTGQVKSIHERALKDADLAGRVFYDWYKRACLLDHFLGGATTIEGFSQCRYEELGDFVNQPFIIKPSKNGVTLARDGQVSGESLRVSKDVGIKKDSSSIEVSYRIKNTSDKKVQLWFGSEFNLSLTNDDTFEQLFGEDGLSLKDVIAGVTVKLTFSRPADIWHFPVKTISQSESGIEENYQSTAVLPHWKFFLSPGQHWDTDILVSLA